MAKPKKQNSWDAALQDGRFAESLRESREKFDPVARRINIRAARIIVWCTNARLATKSKRELEAAGYGVLLVPAGAGHSGVGLEIAGAKFHNESFPSLRVTLQPRKWKANAR